jgi:hypothetical protein
MLEAYLTLNAVLLYGTEDMGCRYSTKAILVANCWSFSFFACISDSDSDWCSEVVGEHGPGAVFCSGRLFPFVHIVHIVHIVHSTCFLLTAWRVSLA